MVPLLTLRLIVRQMSLADLDDYLEFHTHREVVSTMGKPPMDREQASRYLEGQGTLSDDTVGCWHGYALECRETSRVIGEIGMYLQVDPPGEADLGFVMHPDFQRQGLTSEAARAFVQYGFQSLGLARITGHCDVGNIPSQSVLLRIGMQLVSEQNGSLEFAIESRPVDTRGFSTGD